MQENNAKSFVDPEMTKRLNLAIKEQYKTKRKFAAAVGASYEAVRLWCEGKSKPNTDYLTAIAKNTAISIDWLLTGKENTNLTRCGLPNKALDICDMIQDIYASTDEQMHAALHTNLVAFKNSANKDKKIDELDKKVDYLMQLYDRKTISGT